MNLRLMLFSAASLLALSGCGQIPYPEDEVASARSRTGSTAVEDHERAEREPDSRIASANSLDADGSDAQGSSAADGPEEAVPAGASPQRGARKSVRSSDRTHASRPQRLDVPQPVAIATELPTATPAPTQAPAPTADPMANTGPPTRVEIPAIGVDALVERVGLTPDRAMDVPKGWMNVGWYENGFYPGEVGNSVIAGHLDTSTGGPAVFWDLNQLMPGDEVVVTYEDGSRLTFAVVDNRVYDHDAQGAIIESIFGKSLTPDLNLVTCDGAWDHGLATYAKRLVVFTTLLPEKSVFVSGEADLVD